MTSLMALLCDMLTNPTSLLIQAVKGGTANDVKEIFEEFDVAKDDTWFNNELLVTALSRGHKTITNFLLRKGCRVRRDDEICTHSEVLYSAVKLGDVNITKKLLTRGAWFDEKHFDQNSPLYVAVTEKKFEIVDLLLSTCKFKNLNPASEADLAHFHIACMRSSLDIIQRFVNQGFSVNSQTNWHVDEWRGFTALHFAVENFSLRTFHFLLTHDANLYAKDAKGLTPLHLAYYNDDNQRVTAYDMFLDCALSNRDKSSYVNAVDANGVTIFHICCTRNIPKVIEAFIATGIDINSATADCDTYPGYTPLHYAVQSNCEAAIELLLKYGAEVAKPDVVGSTPMHLACRLAHVHIVELLLKSGADLGVQDKEGRTALHCAFYAAEKNDALVNLLLEHIPADLNSTDHQGLSHFHITCTRNDRNRVETFLQNGVSADSCVNFDASSYPGYSALHFAVDFNRKNIVDLLLKYAADVNAIAGSSKITPLHLSCTHSDNKFYQLIDNIPDNEVETIDWTSNRDDQIGIIELLLDRKADINARGSSGKTALFHICEIHSSITTNLRQCLGKFWISTLRGFRNVVLTELNSRRGDIIHMLLQRGADINISTESFASILHMISRDHSFKESMDVVELLLKEGADVNAVNETDGTTPLHVAVKSGHKEFVEVFIKYRADLNARTSYLATPLHVALNQWIVEDSIVQMLLENGSEVNTGDAAGNTPLHVAFANFHTFAVRQLLRHGADINRENKEGRPTMSFFCHKLRAGTLPASDCKPMLDAIEIQLKKLAALGFEISDTVKICCTGIRLYYDASFVDVDRLNEDIVIYTEELERMKRIKIDNYSSLFDILFKGRNEMAKHVKNESLERIVMGGNLEGDFPLYGYLLTLQYQRGLARSAVLNPAKASLQFIADVSLPDSCSEQILRYLSDRNLENLIRAKSVGDNRKRKLYINRCDSLRKRKRCK